MDVFRYESLPSKRNERNSPEKPVSPLIKKETWSTERCMFSVGQINLTPNHLRNFNVGNLGTYECLGQMQMNRALRLCLLTFSKASEST